VGVKYCFSANYIFLFIWLLRFVKKNVFSSRCLVFFKGFFKEISLRRLADRNDKVVVYWFGGKGKRALRARFPFPYPTFMSFVISMERSPARAGRNLSLRK